MTNNNIATSKPVSYFLTASLSVAICYGELANQQENKKLQRIFRIIEKYHLKAGKQLKPKLVSFFKNRLISKNIVNYLSEDETKFKEINPSSEVQKTCYAYELYLLETFNRLIPLTNHVPELKKLLNIYKKKTKGYMKKVYKAEDEF